MRPEGLRSLANLLSRDEGILKAVKVQFLRVYIILWQAGSVYNHHAYTTGTYHCNHVCSFD